MMTAFFTICAFMSSSTSVQNWAVRPAKPPRTFPASQVDRLEARRMWQTLRRAGAARQTGTCAETSLNDT
jgi:hypothetical protein